MQGPRAYADVNAVVGGYLRDLAFAQSSQQKMFGYKRAANAILSLDRPLTDLLGPAGTLPRIPVLKRSRRSWKWRHDRRSIRFSVRCTRSRV